MLFSWDLSSLWHRDLSRRWCLLGPQGALEKSPCCLSAYLASASSRRTCQQAVHSGIWGLWLSRDLARQRKYSCIFSFAFRWTVSLGQASEGPSPYLLMLRLQAANANQEHHLPSCAAGWSVIVPSVVQYKGCYYSQVSQLLHWTLFNSLLEFTNKETSQRNGFFYSTLRPHVKLSI